MARFEQYVAVASRTVLLLRAMENGRERDDDVRLLNERVGVEDRLEIGEEVATTHLVQPMAEHIVVVQAILKSLYPPKNGVYLQRKHPTGRGNRAAQESDARARLDYAVGRRKQRRQ